MCMLKEVHLHLHCCLIRGVSGRGCIFIQDVVFHPIKAPCHTLRVRVLDLIISSNAYIPVFLTHWLNNSYPQIVPHDCIFVFLEVILFLLLLFPV